MFALKKLTEILYKNTGLICFVIALSFLVFGIFNPSAFPNFYEAHSGSPLFDGKMTVLLNEILWFLFCFIIMLSGDLLYFHRKDIKKLSTDKSQPDALHFCFIGVIIIIGTIVYLILLLMDIVNPIQFFPNVLFAGEETPMDLSIIFNALLFFLFISIPYRIGEKFIKYGLKIGDLK